MSTEPDVLDLLSDVDAYLCALHVHAARHDQIGADGVCGGCLLRDRTAAALPALAAAPVPPPTDRDADDAPFGSPDCTCVPFTGQTDPPRYLNRPADTVDMISGWERGRDCPHHAPPTDRAATCDRIAERPERYAVAIHDAMEPDLSLVDQDPGQQALFARAAEAAMALADSEQATLRRKLAAAERIRENADFHLGQEMARRQLAEKEAARLSADRAAILTEAADAVAEEREATDVNVAVYPRWDGRQKLALSAAESLLRRLAAEAPTTTKPETEPTAEEIVREHVTTVHLIAEQLAGIESWMWEHLANVRDTAKTQPEERPRCPHCQMPHDLTPGSLPVAVCESVRQRIAEAERLHSEGDHSICARVDCDVLREQAAAGVRQDGVQP